MEGEMGRDTCAEEPVQRTQDGKLSYFELSITVSPFWLLLVVFRFWASPNGFDCHYRVISDSRSG